MMSSDFGSIVSPIGSGALERARKAKGGKIKKKPIPQHLLVVMIPGPVVGPLGHAAGLKPQKPVRR